MDLPPRVQPLPGLQVPARWRTLCRMIARAILRFSLLIALLINGLAPASAAIVMNCVALGAGAQSEHLHATPEMVDHSAMHHHDSAPVNDRATTDQQSGHDGDCCDSRACHCGCLPATALLTFATSITTCGDGWLGPCGRHRSLTVAPNTPPFRPPAI